MFIHDFLIFSPQKFYVFIWEFGDDYELGYNKSKIKKVIISDWEAILSN